MCRLSPASVEYSTRATPRALTFSVGFVTFASPKMAPAAPAGRRSARAQAVIASRRMWRPFEGVDVLPHCNSEIEKNLRAGQLEDEGRPGARARCHVERAAHPPGEL